MSKIPDNQDEYMMELIRKGKSFDEVLDIGAKLFGDDPRELINDDNEDSKENS